VKILLKTKKEDITSISKASLYNKMKGLIFFSENLFLGSNYTLSRILYSVENKLQAASTDWNALMERHVIYLITPFLYCVQSFENFIQLSNIIKRI
jgi:hypothetical protein